MLQNKNGKNFLWYDFNRFKKGKFMRYIPDGNNPEWGLGYSINHLVTKVRLAVLQGLRARGYDDLTLEQYELLFVLFLNNGVYQRQLSKLLLKDRANITRILNMLEKKKLVIRKSSQNNKKIQEVYITELGKQLVYQAAPVKNSTAEKFWAGFTEEELAELKRLIDKVHANLEGLYTIST